MSTSAPKEYVDSLLRSVQTNQLSPQATAWLSTLLFALDNKDVATYTSYMSPDVTITFNNGDNLEPNMRGINAVRKGLGNFWQSFATIRHEELNIYGTDQNFAHEALNHYETLSGKKVTVRAVAYVDRNGEGNIEALRIYNDQSPLWT